MLRIGNHLPSSKGYLAMGKHAAKLGATTFAFSPETPEAAKQSRLMKQMCRSSWHLRKNMISIIWWHMLPIP